jgi:hypothetical protein
VFQFFKGLTEAERKKFISPVTAICSRETTSCLDDIVVTNSRRIEGKMTRAIENAIFGMFDQIPREWNNDSIAKISSHLRSVRDHAAEFVDQVNDEIKAQ